MEIKSNRRLVREKAMQTLYAYSMNNIGLENLIQSMLVEFTEKRDVLFYLDLVNKCVINAEKYDQEISEKALNWEIDRIAWIDRVLLRIGLCELLNFPDIPPKVTMNELIEIAKEYSTENSGKFINGIIDKMVSTLKEEGRLNKMGRGLIDNDILKEKQ